MISHYERAIRALSIEEPDRIPLFEQAFSKAIVQEILGEEKARELIDELNKTRLETDFTAGSEKQHEGNFASIPRRRKQVGRGVPNRKAVRHLLR